ncbi:MAG TPA: hypothetical protein VEK79_03640 [Thermoanaerobaculia bacterium]|nr:hypothetical protein [Thermoanaerobaculia bacterium]
MSILDRVARFASLELQRRFVVHGTVREYLVAEELAEDLLDIERLLARHGDEFTPAEAACLQQLIQTLNTVGRDLLREKVTSAEELIERDPVWGAIRSAAARCLDCLGFDLHAWEQEELNS